MNDNPFTPSFGEIPAHLAGRTEIIRSFHRALSSGTRKPELTTIFSGARGTGKTALMAYLADCAEQAGWISVRVTALPGMMEDIEIQTRRKASHLVEPPAKLQLERIGIPDVVSLGVGQSVAAQSNWRSRMEDILDELAVHDVGLFIVVDEVDPSLDEMIQTAAIYQQFVIDRRKVALVMAGLPQNTSQLITDKTVSFLRRASQTALRKIDDLEIERAFARTVADANRTLDPEGLRLATESIDGFPFMMQLVGYYAWEENPKEEGIGAEDLRNAIKLARREMESRIFAATFAELSPSDILFLKAMLKDTGSSAIADITVRLGWSSSQVGQYRRRLIDDGIIGRKSRGVVDFELPFFREYLLERFEGEEGL